MQANKTADNQYLIPLIDGTIENIDITDGILLTTSEFVSQEDIEMTTTHDDLNLFQQHILRLGLLQFRLH